MYTVCYSATKHFIRACTAQGMPVAAAVLPGDSFLHILYTSLIVLCISCVCVAQTFFVPIFGNVCRHFF